MSYSESEVLKHLPEVSSFPRFSGAGEYDCMEPIDYIEELSIDVPSIPDYWITSRLNKAFEGHASIWYAKMKEINYRRNWPCWKSQIIQKYSLGTWIWQKTIQTRRKGGRSGKKEKFLSQLWFNRRLCKQLSKGKEKSLYLEKVPAEEFPTEDSASDSMGDAIREHYDDDQDLREELLVEYTEETQLEIQDIQFEAGMPPDTANKNLCKYTQDAQTFLVTPTKGMA
ncbi:hypothetical protein O181_036770 [Austropuccinia psidii MF-1]|uniref:Uncharacterized protein n=1 Tax=Austropuccinia psidii MF-1 TaxID=1389203 RepID=A0A9Q3D729_9BASI|nr:hypothetical protein [Austropuccinia psidii MF-1]